MLNQVPYGSSLHLLYIRLQPSNYRKKSNHTVLEALSIGLIMAIDDLPSIRKTLYPSKTEQLKGADKRDSITASTGGGLLSQPTPTHASTHL